MFTAKQHLLLFDCSCHKYIEYLARAITHFRNNLVMDRQGVRLYYFLLNLRKQQELRNEITKKKIKHNGLPKTF